MKKRVGLQDIMNIISLTVLTTTTRRVNVAHYCFQLSIIHSLQHDTRQAKLAQRPLESLGTVQRRGERYDGTSIRTGPLQSKK